MPGTSLYAATKAEAAILTKRFALELGADGITVNGVAPGFVRTDMTRRTHSPEEWARIERNFSDRSMLHRIGEPEDIANAVAFLAAPESGWITTGVGLDHRPGPRGGWRPDGLYRARMSHARRWRHPRPAAARAEQAWPYEAEQFWIKLLPLQYVTHRFCDIA
jgi:hypothetical protein